MARQVPPVVSLQDIVIKRYDYTDPHFPRSLNFYFDHYDGVPIMRAVAYLSNSGCAWAEKSGGCVMCGTKNFTMHRHVKDTEYLAQLRLIRGEIETYHREHSARVSALCIYNDGLYFNDEEVGPSVRDEIYAMARDLGVKKLVVETSSGDIVRDHQTDNHLGRAIALLGDVKLETALGVESTNQTMRALYNKSDTVDDIKQALKILRAHGALPKAYILLKGPLVSEAEGLADCINSVATLREMEGTPPIHVELQPCCLLPNTLHEHLSSLDESDPYFWEPTLLSTIFKIMHAFPEAGEYLHSAVFAPIDEEQPWSFWLTRPHESETSTHLIYARLAEHYVSRDFEAVKAGLALAEAGLPAQRMARTMPHTLEQRVEVVKQMVELSAQSKLQLSDYLRKHVRGPGNFIDNCLQHLEAVGPVVPAIR